MPLLIAIAISTGSTRARRLLDMPIGPVASPACGDPMEAITPANPKKSRGDCPAAAGAGQHRAHHPVDRAVELGDAEEVGDAGHQDQDAHREAGNHLAQRHAGHGHAHGAGGHEHPTPRCTPRSVARANTTTKMAIAPRGTAGTAEC